MILNVGFFRPICDDCDKDCHMQTTVAPTKDPNVSTTQAVG